ncbi:MAG: NlpC/P60 family protein [bacterium]|nr:NlpC/P60 family protein [bacterium]
MNTKTLSAPALSVIDQYLHLKVGSAVCTVPYFNNKIIKSRGALTALAGKGSPKEIYEEAETLTMKAHISTHALADESLKKLLVDNNIGIDCSGFVYYVLNTESKELGKGTVDKHIHFNNAHGFIRKFLAAVRPVQNTDVSTLSSEKNSKSITPSEIHPGDMITMTDNAGDRDHILVVHQVEYQNFIPYKIHYSHSVAYPEDGIYGTGIKQGVIEITDASKPIIEATWIENGKHNLDNQLYLRARKSKTELRRLKWM